MEGGAYGQELGLGEVLALKQAQIAADHVLARIPGDVLERRVHVDNGIVRGQIVSDTDCADAGFDRSVPQFQVFFRARNRGQGSMHQEIQQPSGGDDKQPCAQGLNPGRGRDLQVEHEGEGDSALDKYPDRDQQ